MIINLLNPREEIHGTMWCLTHDLHSEKHSGVKTIDQTIWSYNLILKLKSLSTEGSFYNFFTLMGEMLSRKLNLGLLLFT